MDIRNEPSITITDTHTKSGQHLKSVLSTEDGTILEESGPNPNKDHSIYFLAARYPWGQGFMDRIPNRWK